MELDELKVQLKQKLEEARGQKSAADIASLLSRKTQSVLEKLQKSLWFEIITCIVFAALLAYVGIFSRHKSLQIYFSVFAILSVAFLGILIYLLQKTKQLGNTQMPVKQNLIALHTLLKDFTRRYFQFTMSLIPVCVIFSGYLGYMDGKHGDTIEIFDKIDALFIAKKHLLLFVAVYLILLVVGTYYFTKWYIKKLYGRYLDELQNCIRELEA